MQAARFPIAGAFASAVFLSSVAASAFNGMSDTPWQASQPTALFQQSRGAIIGFGFGFAPWWGPYDAYAPPAYAYPPPVYSVPPPPPSRLPAAQSRVGCQEFESTVIVDGQQRVARGLACPQADGSWRIVR